MDFHVGLLVLIGIIGAAVAEPNYCPPKEDLKACYCVNGGFYVDPGTRFVCSYMNDTQALYDDVQKVRGYPMDYFMIDYSNFSHLPPGLFSGTIIKVLKIKNSTLGSHYSIHDTNKLSPFNGLENSLEEIRIEMTSEPSGWFHPEMKRLTKLKSFVIDISSLDFVGHFLAGIGSLNSIAVTNSKVNRIHPQAFPELTDLEVASFSGNNIPYLVRTMFSNPAPKLEVLDFSGNQLFTLNQNMFENMPALKSIDISWNKFKTFESSVFKPVWNQLDYFYTSLNPFRCDCSLVALKQKFIFRSYPPNQDFEFIKCRNPGDANATNLPDLDGRSMHC